MDRSKDLMDAYLKYLTNCLFSNKDFFTEEKILTFMEFKEKTLQKMSNNVG